MINKRHTVSGLKSAHGLRRAGKNGPLARHDGLLHMGKTGLADGLRRVWHALGTVTARRACSGWRGGALAGGSLVDGARQGARLQHHC
jgi:hypothetical protein